VNGPHTAKRGIPIDDDRVDAFLKSVLALEGENSNAVRQGVRLYLANCERQFRHTETSRRMKDKAAEAGHMLCRGRVFEEIKRRKGTPTADHLQLVLEVIDRPA
jgi:hypothetical protein